MSNMINLELRKLGLKEKEVAVYLAALELGFDSVQNIAKKAGLSRPTVYEIIKALTAKGLMREIRRQGAVQGERSYFSAQSPDALLGLLRVQKREVEEREREFVRIISALRAKYNLTGQTEIRSFTADEIKFLLDDFSQSQTEDIYFIGSDANALKIWHAKLPEIKKRLGSVNLKEMKKNIPGALIIYDKLIYLPAAEKSALLIENKSIVELIISLLS
ncbi:helix-turn-helix domain-containing protein [Patescibacteria group bacterium]|nr:helix-turn-helix domain-containing protein [Patescibacteria group bacterium]